MRYISMNISDMALYEIHNTPSVLLKNYGAICNLLAIIINIVKKMMNVVDMLYIFGYKCI